MPSPVPHPDISPEERRDHEHDERHEEHEEYEEEHIEQEQERLRKELSEKSDAEQKELESLSEELTKESEDLDTTLENNEVIQDAHTDVFGEISERHSEDSEVQSIVERASKSAQVDMKEMVKNDAAGVKKRGLKNWLGKHILGIFGLGISLASLGTLGTLILNIVKYVNQGEKSTDNEKFKEAARELIMHLRGYSREEFWSRFADYVIKSNMSFGGQIIVLTVAIEILDNPTGFSWNEVKDKKEKDLIWDFSDTAMNKKSMRAAYDLLKTYNGKDKEDKVIEIPVKAECAAVMVALQRIKDLSQKTEAVVPEKIPV